MDDDKKIYDCVIIGGGVIGTSIAYQLSRKSGEFLLLEKQNDICFGTSKANSGIAHGGYDAIPGSNKAKFNVQGINMMKDLNDDLQFLYKEIGALVICHSEEDLPRLQEIKERGVQNGVEGLEIIKREQILKLEPNVADDVVYALYCKKAGIVNPFLMTVAFAQMANINGVEFKMNQKVIDIAKYGDNWLIKTNSSKYMTKTIVNAAGVYSDELSNMVSDNKYDIRARKGEYLLLDKESYGAVNSVIFDLPTHRGKGVLVAPTSDNNIIVGPTSKFIDTKSDVTTSSDGLEKVIELSGYMVKDIKYSSVITSFTGLRAHEQGGDFVLNEEVSGFFNCVGIESPGLTAAPAIGVYMADLVSQKINLHDNIGFIEKREPIKRISELSYEEVEELIKKDERFANVICRCEKVSEMEIVDSLTTPVPANSLDGIKLRTRAMAGRCQGGFCLPKILEIIKREKDIDFESILKNNEGSTLIVGKTK